MEIQPIANADGVSSIAPSDSPLIDYLRQTHAPAAVIALAEAQLKAGETLEQRAAAGDPIALHRLAVEEALHIPQSAQSLQSTPAEHHVVGDHGVHEAGKGDVVDIYD
jgi:hypothetical protein